MILQPGHGRARHLYDEQAQRLQQEKLLILGGAGALRPAILGDAAAPDAAGDPAPNETETKTDAG